MRSRFLYALVGACVVAVLQSGCSYRDKPVKDELLFVRETATGAAVYLMAEDGREVRRLVEGTGPRWSPDGSRFAYIAREDDEKQRHCGTSIWVMNPKTGARRRVVNVEGGVCALAWAPDGVRLAYAGPYAGPVGVGIVDTETGARDIVSLVSGYEGLDWARDGRRLIVSTFVTSALLDTWTRAMRVLVPNRYTGDGRWSPDGARVAVTRPKGVLTKTRLRIFLVDGAGGNLEQITRGAVDSGPSWSPDGKRIYFSRAPDDLFENGTEIWVIDLETRSLRQLTRNDVVDRSPDVRPKDRCLSEVPDPVVGDIVVPDLTGRYVLFEDERRRLRRLGLVLEAVPPLQPPRAGVLAVVDEQAPRGGSRALRGSVVEITGFDFLLFYNGERFSESVWKAHPNCADPLRTRRPMYADVVRRVLRKGMRKRQVLALLGRPSRSGTAWDDWAIGATQLGGAPPIDCFYLRVEFDRRSRATRFHQQPG